jgi:hypothetical protein
MRKILVCDHKFNVESIASSGSNVKFYGLNENISFYDNFDIVNPDCVWINNAFVNLDNYDIKNIPVQIIEYNIPYIIPNSFAKIPNNRESIISCILFDSVPLDRIYKYDNLYIKFYCVKEYPIQHIQYCGKINTCKDITDIICSSDKVIIDSDIIENMCLFYNKQYSVFKPKGTLSWINPSLKSHNIITNIELLSTNEQKYSNLL